MLNFGIIGCGKAAKAHADVIRGLGHRISCVAARENSANISGFAETYGIASRYDDFRKLLGRESPDAIVVATAWNQTERIIDDVIRTGIPCLAEKPVALSSRKLVDIAEASDRFNRQVLVGYNRRFYDFIPMLKESLDSKELISVSLNFPEAVDSMVGTYSEEIRDHILPYMSSHWLDLLLYLMGDAKVECIFRNNNSGGEPRAYNGMLFSEARGAPIHLQAVFNAPAQTSLSFDFVGEIHELRPMERLIVYNGMDILEPGGSGNIRRYVPKVAAVHETGSLYKPGYHSQMKNFIDTCVEKNRPNETGCTLREALRVLELCERIKG